jgi:hypothetical protein
MHLVKIRGQLHDLPIADRTVATWFWATRNGSARTSRVVVWASARNQWCGKGGTISAGLTYPAAE